MNLAVLILLGLSAMSVVGLSLLMGYAGQVSLGQASFYAIGAYTAGLLALHGVPTVVGLLAAPIVSALTAVLVGVPILRLRGHQLAFATLALQLILLSVLGDADWAGGAIGLQGLPYLSVGGFELDQDFEYALLVLAGVVLVSVIARNLVRSRVGRGLRALATGEMAAAASGVPVGAYRLMVFGVSAMRRSLKSTLGGEWKTNRWRPFGAFATALARLTGLTCPLTRRTPTTAYRAPFQKVAALVDRSDVRDTTTPLRTKR